MPAKPRQETAPTEPRKSEPPAPAKEETPTARALTDFPEYAAASDKLYELRAKLNDAQVRIDSTTQTLADLKRHVRQRAEAYLSGKTDKIDDQYTLRSQLERLQSEAEIIAEAITIQEGTVAEATRQCSARICEQLRPAHVALVQRIAAHVAALGKLNFEEQRLRDSIEAAGARSSLSPMSFFAAGDRRNPEAPVCQFIFECGEKGYIDATDPELAELRLLHGRR